jgi:hypothetical protein
MARSKTSYRSCPVALICCLCACAYGVTAMAADVPLSQQIAAAKPAFTPISPAMVQQAREPLVQAIGRLDKYLLTGGANGLAWKKYLLWDELAAQLQPDSVPDEQVLYKVLRQYRLFYPGLELPVFVDVAKALDAYIPVTVAAKNADAKTQFDTHIDRLSSTLGSAEKESTQGLSPEAAAHVGAALGWLHDHRQASDLVAAVRQRWSQPNLHFQASKAFVDAGIARPLNEVAPVSDVILGTNITGTGHTVGKLGVELIPNDRQAVLETVLVGTNHSKTVGRNGPAIVWSQGQTELLARKPIIIDSTGIRTQTAVATAQTHSQIVGVGSTKRGLVDRIVRRAACKKIPQQKGQSEQIASQHAVQRLVHRLETESAPLLAKANADFSDKLRLPLVRRNEFPRLVRFSTTKDALTLFVLDDDLSHLAATSAPPDMTGQPDLSVRFHESFVNNLTYSLLAGETFDQDDIELLTVELLGKLPEQMQGSDGKDPWSITFDSDEPVTLRILEDVVTVTIRGASYTSGSKVYDAMNVTARYKIVKGDFGIVTATRQGDLEILPPGFVPGSGQRLALRQVVLTDLLRRRFGKIFEETIVADGLELPGNWQKLGKLPLTQLTTARGWMALGWEIPAQPGKVAGKTELPGGSVVRLEQE